MTILPLDGPLRGHRNQDCLISKKHNETVAVLRREVITLGIWVFRNEITKIRQSSLQLEKLKENFKVGKELIRVKANSEFKKF